MPEPTTPKYPRLNPTQIEQAQEAGIELEREIFEKFLEKNPWVEEWLPIDPEDRDELSKLLVEDFDKKGKPQAHLTARDLLMWVNAGLIPKLRMSLNDREASELQAVSYLEAGCNEFVKGLLIANDANYILSNSIVTPGTIGHTLAERDVRAGDLLCDTCGNAKESYVVALNEYLELKAHKGRITNQEYVRKEKELNGSLRLIEATWKQEIDKVKLLQPEVSEAQAKLTKLAKRAKKVMEATEKNDHKNAYQAFVSYNDRFDIAELHERWETNINERNSAVFSVIMEHLHLDNPAFVADLKRRLQDADDDDERDEILSAAYVDAFSRAVNAAQQQCKALYDKAHQQLDDRAEYYKERLKNWVRVDDYVKNNPTHSNKENINSEKINEIFDDLKKDGLLPNEREWNTKAVNRVTRSTNEEGKEVRTYRHKNTRHQLLARLHYALPGKLGETIAATPSEMKHRELYDFALTFMHEPKIYLDSGKAARRLHQHKWKAFALSTIILPTGHVTTAKLALNRMQALEQETDRAALVGILKALRDNLDLKLEIYGYTPDSDYEKVAEKDAYKWMSANLLLGARASAELKHSATP